MEQTRGWGGGELCHGKMVKKKTLLEAGSRSDVSDPTSTRSNFNGLASFGLGVAEQPQPVSPPGACLSTSTLSRGQTHLLRRSEDALTPTLVSSSAAAAAATEKMSK